MTNRRIDFNIKLVQEGGMTYFQMTLPAPLLKPETKLINSRLLSKDRIRELGYENGDGSTLIIDWEYFGKKNNPQYPSPGPFQDFAQGSFKLKVWPQ